MTLFSGARRPFQLFATSPASHPLRVFITTLKTFFFAHLIWDHFYAYAQTWGPSMLPTFEVIRDGVIVDRAYKRGRGIKVGDIVTFDSIAQPGEKVIKRVLGLQGDYVLIDTPGSGSDRMIQVPEGHCWLVGDNLPTSRDSRMFGPVPMAVIQGKIISKVTPLSERRWLEDILKPRGVNLEYSEQH